MFKRIFSKESLAVFKNKKLMLALTAILFVPVLYGGMFLWAFWDPYDGVGDIPVAIVNEDQPYEFEEEIFDLGDELVKRLKDEDDFDLHFVSKEVGYAGLEDEDYYMLIEIPQDFSKNATTLMDDHPNKLQLYYVPNESYNFLASQIGETAMLQIEQALEEKLIETYTETIFDKIDEVAEGLAEAEDATGDLDEGAEEIQSNTHKLKDHLQTLAEKSVEFVDGTGELKEGGQLFVQGTATLEDGVEQLYDASGQLLGGAGELGEGSIDLEDGLSLAESGLGEIDENLPQLLQGMSELLEGISEFEAELPKQLGAEIDQALEIGNEQLDQGLAQLEEAINHGLGASSKNKDGLATQLSQGLTEELEKELNKVGDQAKEVPEEIADKIASKITNPLGERQEKAVKRIKETMEKLGLPEEQIETILEVITEDIPSAEEIHLLLTEQITERIEDRMFDVDALIASKQKEIEKSVKDGVFYAVGETEKEISAGFQLFSKELDHAIAEETPKIEKSIAKGTEPAFAQLKDGTKELEQGQRTLQSGIKEVTSGTEELSKGARTLSEGQQEFVSQFALFTSQFDQAKEGAQDLAEASKELFNGVLKMDDGVLELKQSADDLAQGSSDLATGTDDLKAGTEEFNEEMSKAAKEAGDVHATEETHNMMANPVEVETEKINEVPNYGTGFAPYFISLGLYVGALLLSIVYPLRAPTITPTSGFNWFLRKTAGLGVIGLIQAILVASILLFGLGIEVQSVALFYMYAIFTSWTFIAIVQFLVTCFDDPGRFAAILILILQLTTSAGTFPLELIPKMLQPFNAILPMTYSVTGFKAVISSGNFNVMWQTSFILGIFTSVCLLLTLSYFLLIYKRKAPMMRKQEA